MRRVLTSRLFLFATLALICLSVLSFFYLRSACVEPADKSVCCPAKMDSNTGGEMLWDILSHQFVTLTSVSQ